MVLFKSVCQLYIISIGYASVTAGLTLLPRDANIHLGKRLTVKLCHSVTFSIYLKGRLKMLQFSAVKRPLCERSDIKITRSVPNDEAYSRK